MSWRAAAFFSWLQNTPVYSVLHTEAVALLPPGNGQSWLDIGCGPGLVARLASAHGYGVLGVDRDPAMISFARRQARGLARCAFEAGELGDLPASISADVVSAASLLFVMPDPGSGILDLWQHVRPGGRLLVIETSELMTPARARMISREMDFSDRLALKLWAQARNGRSIAPQIFSTLPDCFCECVPLLEELARAWIWTKAAA